MRDVTQKSGMNRRRIRFPDLRYRRTPPDFPHASGHDPSKQTGRLPRSRNRQNFPANNPWVDVPKNLRLVQEHLRHADIQTTTVYTRVTQHELQQAVSVFDKTRS